MKWFYLSIALCLISAAAGAGYLYQGTRDLDSFCSGVPLGATVAQVRKAAQRQGFESFMEPFTQMRIRPLRWHMSPPSCRVFFNRDRTVEFRQLQAT
jgi:hypothetical protein